VPLSTHSFFSETICSGVYSIVVFILISVGFRYLILACRLVSDYNVCFKIRLVYTIFVSRPIIVE